MLFNSVNFIVFIITFIPLYFMVKGKARLWVSLLGSYLFYGWWDYRFLFLLLTLTIITYCCGLNITSQTPLKKKRVFLFISIFSCLAILGFFKYYNFFINNLLLIPGWPTGGHFTTLHVILPVGISFYTFKIMGYTIDLYRGKFQPENSLLKFALFVAFFPQLLAGPIVRAANFFPQLRTDRACNPEDILHGIHLIIWGVFLKVALADSLAMVVDVRYANVENQNALSMLVGVVFYSFQIYGDFAGYSYISIGIARMLGFRIPMNFNRPYFSRSFSDFWQRWHISLSSWLRDYLYIPLGGNRAGKLKTYRNLLVTMLLGGLWHGASWNFMIWGGIHGLYLAGQRSWGSVLGKGPFLEASGAIGQTIVPIVKIIFTFGMVCLAWVFFRAADFHDSRVILERIFQFGDYDFHAVTQKFHVIKGAILILVLIVFEGVSLRINTDNIQADHPNISCLWSAGLLVLISLFGTFGNNTFIYFQF